MNYTNNNNDENKFVVFRPDEKRFSKITKHRRFTKARTMNSKIFKTYILQYIKKDPRLDQVELVYYLDVDIVFGNSIQPLFEGLERMYRIGAKYQNDDAVATSKTKTNTAKIYYFEGNGSQEIQGGQIVLERNSSQPCLDRWRFLMQQNRTARSLNDQYSLKIMLAEQRSRRGLSNSTSGGGVVVDGGGIDKKKEEQPECEIVLMKQDKALIQFPELIDIEERANQMIEQQKQQTTNDEEGGQKQHDSQDQQSQKYPTLLHFRNSANVMKSVEEESLQLYMRDILRFDFDQEDELGILNKMIMGKKVKVKKSV